MDHAASRAHTHTRLRVDMFSFLWRKYLLELRGPRRPQEAPGGVSRSFPAVWPRTPADSLRDTGCGLHCVSGFLVSEDQGC